MNKVNDNLFDADYNLINEMTFPELLVFPRDLVGTKELTRKPSKFERMVNELDEMRFL